MCRMKWIYSFIVIGMSLCVVGCGVLFPTHKETSSGYYHTNWSSEGTVLTNKLEVTEEAGRLWSHNRIYGNGYILDIDPDNPTSETVLLTHTVGNNANPSSKLWESVTAMETWLQSGSRYFVYKSYDYNDSRAGSIIRFYKNGLLLKSVQENVKSAQEERGDPDFFQLYLDSFYYNSDSNQLLLSIGDEKFLVFDSEGTILKEINFGGGAIWKEAGVILFYHSLEHKLAEYRMDTDVITVYPVSFVPEWFSSIENAVYGVEGEDLKKCNLQTHDITLVKHLQFDKELFTFHSFSRDGTRLLLFPYISSVESSTGNTYGVNIYHLETDVLTKIRD